MIVHKRVRKLSEDPYLARFMPAIDERALRTESLYKRLCGKKKNLDEFASAHEFYVLHRTGKGWTFERALEPASIWLVGDFQWLRKPEYRLERISDDGDWESDACSSNRTWATLPPGNGMARRRRNRIPSYVRQSSTGFGTKLFQPGLESHYHTMEIRFCCSDRDPLFTRCHIGMAQERPKKSTYVEFKNKFYRE